jgi:hypothetical protein
MSSGSTFAEPWPDKNYNPKPDVEDVILPMPCEGAMAFRRVQVPVNGPLEDLPIQEVKTAVTGALSSTLILLLLLVVSPSRLRSRAAIT